MTCVLACQGPSTFFQSWTKVTFEDKMLGMQAMRFEKVPGKDMSASLFDIISD